MLIVDVLHYLYFLLLEDVSFADHSPTRAAFHLSLGPSHNAFGLAELATALLPSESAELPLAPVLQPQRCEHISDGKGMC